MDRLRKPLLPMAAAFAALALGACSGERAGADETAAATPGDPVAAAISHGDRPAGDSADDALRKPGAVLAFAGVAPGDRVFEMEAGAGYYTELLSRVVGPDGEVAMQNPPAFDAFAAEAIDARLKDDRLANVRLTKTNFDELRAEDGSQDIVTWFLGPHELYFTPAGVDTLGDPETAYAEIFRILKPGGYFVVLDHAARPGAPATTGGETHRIDPNIVKMLADAAGFELADQSSVLRNPDDNYDVTVFDPSVRRKTDRFLLKFRKPA